MRTWTGRVFIGISLDGFIARPDGDIDWLEGASMTGDHAPGDPDLPDDHGYAAHMASVDHLVMGRGTYEKVLTFGGWPFPDHRVVVISSTLESDDDRITIVRSVDAAVRLLDERGARGVYVDGGRTIQAFLREGLIDELVITRLPVLIGEGLPLFGPLPHDIHLIHEGTVSTGGSGFVQSRYRVRRDPVNRS
ncbi:MAG TPA: dihydrofolate reductase family protein [Candidatus Limnocylindrales bacterium]|nr:dihydrofolate reductase family protein [Candidatus Limnocylindrales bacterium]